ncbi:MAG: DUF3093 domain-containing protein [Microbacteriaceae bacterium]|nr:DUF3093 domain-containing protein [Microbacteriaceae bacterium]
MRQDSRNTEYQERVLPSLATYAALLIIPGSLFLVFLPFGEDIALLSVLISSTALLLVSFALSPKIQLKDQHLQVGRASIPINLLGKAEAIRGSDVFVARGRDLSPLAYTKFQSGVKDIVRVELRDEKDPTPYWVFSSRNAEILAARINKI